jgi:hypothetical protein
MFLDKIGRPSIYIPMPMVVCGFLSVLMGQSNSVQHLSLEIINGVKKTGATKGCVLLLAFRLYIAEGIPKLHGSCVYPFLSGICRGGILSWCFISLV